VIGVGGMPGTALSRLLWWHCCSDRVEAWDWQGTRRSACWPLAVLHRPMGGLFGIGVRLARPMHVFAVH